MATPTKIAFGSGSSAPSTPVAQTARTSSGDPTGSWRHPRLDEIARRRSAATFSDRNIKDITWNMVFLVVSFAVGSMSRRIPTLGALLDSMAPYSGYVLAAFRLVFLYNMSMAALPLFKTPDDLSDIPLTPGQRKLLGLPPSSSKPTPETKFITPPRYPRSSSSNKGSPLASPSGSPSSRYGSESPLSGTPRGSPFQNGSPYQNGSPLLQKAIGATNGNRRHSFGSPSPLGPGLGSRTSAFDISGAPASPSPVGKPASVGLNNRWLYEKGRGSTGSGSSRLFS